MPRARDGAPGFCGISAESSTGDLQAPVLGPTLERSPPFTTHWAPSFPLPNAIRTWRFTGGSRTPPTPSDGNASEAAGSGRAPRGHSARQALAEPISCSDCSPRHSWSTRELSRTLALSSKYPVAVQEGSLVRFLSAYSEAGKFGARSHAKGALRAPPRKAPAPAPPVAPRAPPSGPAPSSRRTLAEHPRDRENCTPSPLIPSARLYLA